ncbi:hypothetical protein [Halomarina oriensis]|uniref:Uncharacterized protein n=1 Tax=Halomarina oriensis TaxID=671145 RepID=A0A6B0GQX7_9EURY|nr:hypothetical protein [Halomarina oriensis]MWG35999.1 hypothetical protein [Halomarina oriensis]
MTDDRRSPSGGWREVYAEMGVSADHEPDSLDCPTCGDDCPRLHTATYWCPTHGTWRVAVG